MLAALRRDVRSAQERDPAARGALEVVLCYPGLHAVWWHRCSHALWRRGFRLAARLSSQLARLLTGVEIHPGATIGPGLFIDHGAGVVIGQTAEVGADVTMYHGVTLGGTGTGHGKRHPTVEDGVMLGAGAKVLGPVRIGARSRVGANAVVVRDVPPDSVVVGVPGQVIARSRPTGPGDRDHGDGTLMPDLLGASLLGLLRRVDALESAADLDVPAAAGDVRPSPSGVWAGEDFSI